MNEAPAATHEAEFGLRVRKARHDLHNCITHVLGFVELLLEELSPDRSPSLQGIQRIARDMLARINQELDAARTGRRRSDFLALQQRVCSDASRIASASEKLRETPVFAARPELRDDLDRIVAAGKRIFELASTALPALTKPSSAEPISPVELSLKMPDNPARATVAIGQETTVRRQGSILVIDDLQENRELLARRLAREGYAVQAVESGAAGLECVQQGSIDLVLLDVMMPGMDGFEVLHRLKQSQETRHIGVIMLSSADEVDTVVRCIELGADDFIPKPFNSTLLLARIESSLSRKRLRDQEGEFLKRLQTEQQLSERLLLNILPEPIAQRLKQGETVIADYFPEATVLFTDFVGFTGYASRTEPKYLVGALNAIFSAFDQLCGDCGLEKIKMIGDAYMAVAGVPTPRADHAEAAAELALAMQRELPRFVAESGYTFKMRAGLNSGPLIAGVIGTKKFAYDLWGDTVNLASRMESHAPAGGILVTAATWERLRYRYAFEPGQLLQVKGQGQILTYLLSGRLRGRLATTM